jgi:hypothetical protein
LSRNGVGDLLSDTVGGEIFSNSFALDEDDAGWLVAGTISARNFKVLKAICPPTGMSAARSPGDVGTIPWQLRAILSNQVMIAKGLSPVMAQLRPSTRVHERLLADEQRNTSFRSEPYWL